MENELKILATTYTTQLTFELWTDLSVRGGVPGIGDIRLEEIISLDNLLHAWREFARGKRNKPDVQLFQMRLMDHIIALNSDLQNKTYRHGEYKQFNISDPKPRRISKACVRDRLLHHAIYRVLYPYFDRNFIYDSYSCRNGKGAHKAINRFRFFARKVSYNDTRGCWILQCDIRKFFDSIDHSVLMSILREYIVDEGVLWLLEEIIGSFSSGREGCGLPLGNLTSQLLVNVYMNAFDQFVKHQLYIRYYIRYADDFVILSEHRAELKNILSQLNYFLTNCLHLKIHPDKVHIRTLASGVDFLGWVHFPHHRILRTSTKRRMLERVNSHPTAETLASYMGMLKHGNTYCLGAELLHLAAQND